MAVPMGKCSEPANAKPVGNGPGDSPPARSSPNRACAPTWPSPKNKHGASPKKSPSSVTGSGPPARRGCRPRPGPSHRPAARPARAALRRAGSRQPPAAPTAHPCTSRDPGAHRHPRGRPSYQPPARERAQPPGHLPASRHWPVARHAPADVTTGGQPCGYGTYALAHSDRLICFHVVTLSEVGLPAGSVECWPACALIRLIDIC